MAGKLGVKETKEAILAVVILGAFVAERMKDGAQLDDAMALGMKLMADGDFKSKVMAGIDGMDKVIMECGELDLADGLELAKMIPEIVAAIQAKA